MTLVLPAVVPLDASNATNVTPRGDAPTGTPPTRAQVSPASPLRQRPRVRDAKSRIRGFAGSTTRRSPAQRKSSLAPIGTRRLDSFDHVWPPSDECSSDPSPAPRYLPTAA